MTHEAADAYGYIDYDELPVLINRMGGKQPFMDDIDRQRGFFEIREVEDGDDPLTLEEQYPVNSDSFEYGWIAPDGTTYATAYEDHSHAADVICNALGYSAYGCERELEKRDWVKVTSSLHSDDAYTVVSDSCKITQEQADKLIELGLDSNITCRRLLKMNHFLEEA